MRPDGRQVEPPISHCELQGYVYDAWLRMAEIYDIPRPTGGRGTAAKEVIRTR